MGLKVQQGVFRGGGRWVQRFNRAYLGEEVGGSRGLTGRIQGRREVGPEVFIRKKGKQMTRT